MTTMCGSGLSRCLPRGSHLTSGERAQSKPASEKRKKLSFKEKREMEALPGQIEKLESELRELHATMADPSFYKRDRAAIAQAKSRVDELESSLCGCL